MDFNTLLSNPKQFIDNVAQISEDNNDLGIKCRVDQFLNENPQSINDIPIVATLGHLQMTPPGSLVRLRCVIVQFVDTEYVYLRQFCNGRYYTSFFQQEIPIGADIPEQTLMADRKVFLVTSIPFISQWMVSEFTPDVKPPDPHLNLQEYSSDGVVKLFEESFQVNAKFYFDQPDLPCLVYDLIGFIDDPAPFSSKGEFDLQAFFTINPSFIVLTSIPIKSLYLPQIPLPEPPLSEVRGYVMNFLTQIFDPPQAELLLLWMIGSVKTRKDEIILGLFSLNLFGATPQVAQAVIHLLRFLLTSVIDISLDIESLNSISLQPSIENSSYKPTPLIAACETRLVIDETGLKDGIYNETGIENLRILRQLYDRQIVSYFIEGDYFDIFVSYPTLIISQTKTILSDNTMPVQAFYPIGNIKQPDINIDPNMLAIIRRYIENVRFCDFTISDEDTESTEKQLFELLKSDHELTQRDLHLVMIIAKLSCISLGINKITKEIWDHSVQILGSLLPHKKK